MKTLDKAIKVLGQQQSLIKTQITADDVAAVVGAQPDAFGVGDNGDGQLLDCPPDLLELARRAVASKADTGLDTVEEWAKKISEDVANADGESEGPDLKFFFHGKHPGTVVTTAADLKRVWASDDWNEGD
jgi:hypothetical protein